MTVTGRRTFGAALLLLGFLLAACSSPVPPQQRSSSSGRAVIPPGGAACVVDLNYAGAAFDRTADTAKPQGCGVATGINLYAMPTMLNRPVTVDCGLAEALATWDRTVVQPTAREIFGQDVVKVHHYGGYVCRERRSGGRLSEHAFGRAIDVAAFELADGTVISVHRQWNAGDARQRFLRQVSAGACPFFSVVLSPNSDADHANHLHLDVGPWKLCSP